ncbi:hypothetical protein BGZ94_000091, partial [Podila epigama]
MTFHDEIEHYHDEKDDLSVQNDGIFFGLRGHPLRDDDTDYDEQLEGLSQTRVVGRDEHQHEDSLFSDEVDDSERTSPTEHHIRRHNISRAIRDGAVDAAGDLSGGTHGVIDMYHDQDEEPLLSPTRKRKVQSQAFSPEGVRPKPAGFHRSLSTPDLAGTSNKAMSPTARGTLMSLRALSKSDMRWLQADRTHSKTVAGFEFGDDNSFLNRPLSREREAQGSRGSPSSTRRFEPATPRNQAHGGTFSKRPLSSGPWSPQRPPMEYREPRIGSPSVSSATTEPHNNEDSDIPVIPHPVSRGRSRVHMDHGFSSANANIYTSMGVKGEYSHSHLRTSGMDPGLKSATNLIQSEEARAALEARRKATRSSHRAAQECYALYETLELGTLPTAEECLRAEPKYHCLAKVPIRKSWRKDSVVGHFYASTDAGFVCQVVLDNGQVCGVSYRKSGSNRGSALDSEDFKNSFSFINPYFKLPSRDMIPRMLDERVMTQKMELKKYLNNNVYHGAITVNRWIGLDGRKFLGVTYHFLTPDFRPVSLVIGMERSRGPQTAEVVLEKLSKHHAVDQDINSKIQDRLFGKRYNFLAANVTRWNSEFKMASRVLLLKDTIGATYDNLLAGSREAKAKGTELAKYLLGEEEPFSQLEPLDTTAAQDLHVQMENLIKEYWPINGIPDVVLISMYLNPACPALGFFDNMQAEDGTRLRDKATKLTISALRAFKLEKSRRDELSTQLPNGQQPSFTIRRVLDPFHFEAVRAVANYTATTTISPGDLAK